jgi:hypothetical protein
MTTEFELRKLFRKIANSKIMLDAYDDKMNQLTVDVMTEDSFIEALKEAKFISSNGDELTAKEELT